MKQILKDTVMIIIGIVLMCLGLTFLMLPVLIYIATGNPWWNIGFVFTISFAVAVTSEGIDYVSQRPEE